MANAITLPALPASATPATTTPVAQLPGYNAALAKAQAAKAQATKAKAKVATKAKAAATKAATKAAAGVPNTTTIRVYNPAAKLYRVYVGNPKRPHTQEFARYAQLHNGITIGAYVQAIKPLGGNGASMVHHILAKGWYTLRAPAPKVVAPAKPAVAAQAPAPTTT